MTEDREPSFREIKYSIEQLKYLMTKDTIRVNDTVIDHFNNLLKILNYMMNQDDKPESSMLETNVMWSIRQICELYSANNDLTPEFIQKFVVPKVDMMLKTNKDYQRDQLANSIVMQRLQKIRDPRVLLIEDKIKEELDVLVKDLINYNRMYHDNRISQQGN